MLNHDLDDDPKPSSQGPPYFVPFPSEWVYLWDLVWVQIEAEEREREPGRRGKRDDAGARPGTGVKLHDQDKLPVDMMEQHATLALGSGGSASRAVFLARRVANVTVSGWLPDHAVIAEHGRIVAVVPRRGLPQDTWETMRVHELGDVSLLPGLIDVHAHLHCSSSPDAYDLVMTESREQLLLRAAVNVRTALLSGVTTLRDLGSRNDIIFALRDAIRAGIVPGPRLLLAGTPITTTAGHCYMFGTEANTLDQVVAAIRRQRKLGADCIKIMATGGAFTPTANPRTAQYSEQTLRVAVVEAERLGLPVAAHVQSALGVRDCVAAGVHHLVHCRWYSGDPDRGLEYDPEVARQIAARGCWVDITLGDFLLGREAAEAGAVPPSPHWALARTPVSLEAHIETARDMRRRGVRFTTGLDMGMAHAPFDRSAANARAFVQWLEYTPWQALAASTIESAEALGIGAETGALRQGLAADLMSVQGDPADSIARLEGAVDVIQAGRPVKLGGRALV